MKSASGPSIWRVTPRNARAAFLAPLVRVGGLAGRWGGGRRLGVRVQSFVRLLVTPSSDPRRTWGRTNRSSSKDFRNAPACLPLTQMLVNSFYRWPSTSPGILKANLGGARPWPFGPGAHIETCGGAAPKLRLWCGEVEVINWG